MSCTLTVQEALDVFRPQIDEFQRLGDKFPDGSSEEACTEFSRQVSIGEGALHAAYRITVKAVRHDEDPGNVAGCWSLFLNFCDGLACLLNKLKGRFPHCGTVELYDQTLDYRLAATKRKEHALEEKECLAKGIPEGLFPPAS